MVVLSRSRLSDKRFFKNPMKKVISLALFGEDNRYSQFLPAVIRAHHTLFPREEGWILRIHHDEHVYTDKFGAMLHGLETRGLIELRYMGSGVPLCKAMLWRLAPLFDPEVEVTFCRDLDALPTPRDRACCEEFLASDKLIHTIHDSSSHDGIMGGMSGFKASLRQHWPLTSLEQVYSNAENPLPGQIEGKIEWHIHGADQDALNRVFDAQNLFIHRFKHRKSTLAVTNQPTPDAAPEGFFTPEILSRADSLAPHLGAAGFEIAPALEFYNQHGRHTETIKEAELYAHTMSFEDFVVLSSDARQDYSFFIPLTCIMWQAQGFMPILFLAGSIDEWYTNPRLKLAITYARSIGVRLHFLGNFEGHQTSTMAQVARLCGGSLRGIPGDTYLMTSDMDMWPLGSWPGGKPVAEGKPIQLYYANAYGQDPAFPAPYHFPMCYIGMTAATWRSVMGHEEGKIHEAVGGILSQCTELIPEGHRKSDWEWNFDEIYFGRKIAPHLGACDLINRDFSALGQMRIDRGGWGIPQQGILSCADSHLVRPGFTPENWPRIRPLLEASLQSYWLQWCDEYVSRYVEAQ